MEPPGYWTTWLLRSFLHMAANGTEQYGELDAKERREFEEIVKAGQWLRVVDEVQREAEAEANVAGLELPKAAREEGSAAGVKFGVALSTADRDRLRALTHELCGTIAKIQDWGKSHGKSGPPTTPKSQASRIEDIRKRKGMLPDMSSVANVLRNLRNVIEARQLNTMSSAQMGDWIETLEGAQKTEWFGKLTSKAKRLLREAHREVLSCSLEKQPEGIVKLLRAALTEINSRLVTGQVD